MVVATLMAYLQEYLLTFRKLKPILSMTFEKHKKLVFYDNEILVC